MEDANDHDRDNLDDENKKNDERSFSRDNEPKRTKSSSNTNPSGDAPVLMDVHHAAVKFGTFDNGSNFTTPKKSWAQLVEEEECSLSAPARLDDKNYNFLSASIATVSNSISVNSVGKNSVAHAVSGPSLGCQTATYSDVMTVSPVAHVGPPRQGGRPSSPSVAVASDGPKDGSAKDAARSSAARSPVALSTMATSNVSAPVSLINGPSLVSNANSGLVRTGLAVPARMEMDSQRWTETDALPPSSGGISAGLYPVREGTTPFLSPIHHDIEFGHISNARLIEFGGIPEFAGRSSERIRAQPNADATQMERAIMIAQRRNDFMQQGTSSCPPISILNFSTEEIISRADRMGVSMGESLNEQIDSVKLLKDTEIHRHLTILQKEQSETDQNPLGPHSLVVSKLSNLCADLEEEEVMLVAAKEPPRTSVMSRQRVKKTYDKTFVRRSTRLKGFNLNSINPNAGS
jgi:hypothetical protein